MTSGYPEWSFKDWWIPPVLPVPIQGTVHMSVSSLLSPFSTMAEHIICCGAHDCCRKCYDYVSLNASSNGLWHSSLTAGNGCASSGQKVAGAPSKKAFCKAQCCLCCSLLSSKIHCPLLYKTHVRTYADDLVEPNAVPFNEVAAL